MKIDGQNNRNEDGLNLTGRELLHMSAGSFILYLSIATLLFYFFHDEGLFQVFTQGHSFYLQLLIGLGAGAAAAGIIVFFSTRNPMGPVLEDFSIFKILKNSNFTWFDRVQISFFAGVGEEILFRGAVQPLAGIWLTSFIFIALHGYVSFKSAGHVLFTILLFGLSMMLGLLFEIFGLLSAITAHAVYDFLMLWWVKEMKK
jgi:uncharacterized protein